MVEATDFTPVVTVEQIEGTETRRLTCDSCDWMETGGSKAVATRKKNTHLAEHRGATEGAPGVPTIMDGIEGRNEIPPTAFREPVPVGQVIEGMHEFKVQAKVSDIPEVTPVEPERHESWCDGTQGCGESGCADNPNAVFHTKACRESTEACDGSLGCYRISDGHPVAKAELCPWCDRLHPGGPENCNDVGQKDAAEPIETANGWSVTPASADPYDVSIAEFVAEVVEEGGEEFTQQVMDEVVAQMVGPPPPAWSEESMTHVLRENGLPLPIGWASPKNAEERARRLEITPPHTRTVTDAGPDYCKECSDEAQDWIVWPCPYIEPRMPEHHLPDVPLAVALTRSRLAAQKGPSDFDKDMADSAWHKARAESVSATLAAKLGSAADVDYLIAREVRERLNAQRFWGNAYTRWGKEREPHIEAAALLRHGIEPESHLYFARGNPRHTASPDGIVVHPTTGEVRLGEYKTSGKELTWKKVISNGYYDQVQWQLHVLEADHCWLMWEWRHGEKADYSTYVPEPGGEYLIMRDEERIAELVRRADRFLEALDRAREEQATATTAVIDPELLHLVSEHLEARAAQKAAEEALREYCEANGVKSLEIDGLAKVSYTLPDRGRSTFNRERFEADHPGLYENYVEEGAPPERATLRVTPPKGDDEG